MSAKPVESSNENLDENVLLEREGKIGFITLNRPRRLNAMDGHTHELFVQRLKEADRDADSRVIVITGAGRGFCSGGDVNIMKGNRTGLADKTRPTVYSPGRDLVAAMLRVEKPVIAMVNGVAAGLGATIALFSDIVIMANEATIGDRHVNIGLVAGDGGAVIWPLLVGPARAKELLMTGRMLGGEEACRLGLVSQAVPLAQLRVAVMKQATELASLAPYAVMGTKAAVNRLVSAVSSTVLDSSLSYEHLSMKLNDHQEAVSAFLEKRIPNFTGT